MVYSVFVNAAGRGPVWLLFTVMALYEVTFGRVIEIMDWRYQVAGFRLE